MTLNALIVGGTSGIGKGIALALAKKGNINITIAGRSSTRGKEVVEELQKASSTDQQQQQHSFRQVDAFNLQSIKNLTTNPNNDTEIEPPDLLVMTQGMATTQGYTPTTTDGIDQKMQLHYFSRLYLSNLLAPKMKEGSRILTVLSAGVHNRYSNYRQHFDLKNDYSIQNAADAAGFYDDAGFGRLASRHPSLVICHACPGFVNTNWGTEFPWYVRGVVRLIQPLGRSLEKCGDILTGGWLDLPVGGEGKLHLMDQNGKPVTNGITVSEEEEEFIWEKTMELLPKS